MKKTRDAGAAAAVTRACTLCVCWRRRAACGFAPARQTHSNFSPPHESRRTAGWYDAEASSRAARLWRSQMPRNFLGLAFFLAGERKAALCLPFNSHIGNALNFATSRALVQNPTAFFTHTHPSTQSLREKERRARLQGDRSRAIAHRTAAHAFCPASTLNTGELIVDLSPLFACLGAPGGAALPDSFHFSRFKRHSQD